MTNYYRVFILQQIYDIKEKTLTFFDPIPNFTNFKPLIKMARIYFNLGPETKVTKVAGGQKGGLACGVWISQYIKYFLLDQTHLFAANIRHVTIFKKFCKYNITHFVFA